MNYQKPFVKSNVKVFDYDDNNSDVYDHSPVLKLTGIFIAANSGPSSLIIQPFLMYMPHKCYAYDIMYIFLELTF